jgi:hypothetical protein
MTAGTVRAGTGAGTAVVPVKAGAADTAGALVTAGTTAADVSDIRAKHDIVLLGRLDSGLGFYRFSYLGSDKAYVGVMAQEVEAIRPDAVMRGSDGYLRVNYDRLGLYMQTWEEWVASGERIPATAASTRH